MTGSQHFSPGDIQFQLVHDRGQCAESSHLDQMWYRPYHNLVEIDYDLLNHIFMISYI